MLPTYCKNYKKILRIFFFCITQTVFGHNGSISGSVKDSINNQPLNGVAVQLIETNTTTQTNNFGVYTFSNLPKGYYHLEIQTLGYATIFMGIEVNDAATSQVDILLQQAPISLESVTIQSNKTHQENTVSAIDIKLRPIESAQDLLRLVPGLFIAQHAGGGKAEQIFLRGFDIDHGTDISVNVDGMPVNMVSHAHGQGYADLHFVIPETIQSFDFLKGPYSAQYADFATAGSINFKTADYFDQNLIKFSAGQFNTMRTLLLLQIPFTNDDANSQSAYIAGEYHISDGPFESPQNFKRTNLFAKYRSLINNNTILTFSASTFGSSWNASGQVPTRAVEQGLIDRFGSIDDKEGGYTSRSNLNFELTKNLNSGNTISNQIYYTDYRFELYSNFTFFLEDSINGDMIKQKEHRNLYGYKSTFTHQGYFLGKTVSSSAGIGLRYDIIHNDELSHVAERDIFLNYLALGNVYQTNGNVFASATIDLTPKLQVNPIVRYDLFSFGYDNKLDSAYNYQQVQDGILTYKLNFDYTINQNTLVYLYTGKGFHSNDTRVVVAQNGLQTLPAAYGADFGMRFKPYKNLVLNPAAWILYLEQEFVYVGDAAIVEAGGKTLRRGLDLSARWEITKWLFLDADVNYTFAEALGEPEGANKIPLAANLTSIGGINVRTQTGWSGSFRYRYMGDRPANETGSVIAEGYLVNDLIVNYTISKFEFDIEIQNLFNVDWNEAQFDTESRLQGEAMPVSELHFTPGVPFFLKAGVGMKF